MGETIATTIQRIAEGCPQHQQAIAAVCRAPRGLASLIVITESVLGAANAKDLLAVDGLLSFT